MKALSPRECEVLELTANGATTPQIRDQLYIASATLRAHQQSILTKLGVHSKCEAVTWAWRHGMIRRDSEGTRRLSLP